MIISAATMSTKKRQVWWMAGQWLGCLVAAYLGATLGKAGDLVRRGDSPQATPETCSQINERLERWEHRIAALHAVRAGEPGPLTKPGLESGPPIVPPAMAPNASGPAQVKTAADDEARRRAWLVEHDAAMVEANRMVENAIARGLWTPADANKWFDLLPRLGPDAGVVRMRLFEALNRGQIKTSPQIVGQPF